jgi:hypothetical protein
VRELYRAGLEDRHAVPGMVVSIQTYGDLANWQPHLHALVSAGVVNREGVFTPLALPPAGVAEELFRRRVIRMLRERGRLEEEAAAGLLSWRHSGFSVHHAIRVDPCDTEGVERLCRLCGAPHNDQDFIRSVPALRIRPVELNRVQLPAMQIVSQSGRQAEASE